MAVNADIRSAADLRKSVYEILGIVNGAIPSTDGAVLAYVRPEGNALGRDVERELNYIRERNASRARLAPLSVTDDVLEIGSIEQMLRADVRIAG